MTLVLVRVDDRLIHGQVSVGWAQALQPDRIILANDVVAGNPSLRGLYTMAIPAESSASLLTLSEAAEMLTDGAFAGDKAILVVESPGEVLTLREKGVEIHSVNVGGLHHTDGKRCLLPYVFVSEDDVKAFRKMLTMGMEVECRDVPSARKIYMQDLLERNR